MGEPILVLEHNNNLNMRDLMQLTWKRIL